MLALKKDNPETVKALLEFDNLLINKKNNVRFSSDDVVLNIIHFIWLWTMVHTLPGRKFGVVSRGASWTLSQHEATLDESDVPQFALWPRKIIYRRQWSIVPCSMFIVFFALPGYILCVDDGCKQGTPVHLGGFVARRTQYWCQSEKCGELHHVDILFYWHCTDSTRHPVFYSYPARTAKRLWCSLVVMVVPVPRQRENCWNILPLTQTRWIRYVLSIA